MCSNNPKQSYKVAPVLPQSVPGPYRDPLRGPPGGPLGGALRFFARGGARPPPRGKFGRLPTAKKKILRGFCWAHP